MGWYDIFSSFYDSSLEKLYVEQRRLAAEALDLKAGHVVLDLPAGTGQSFDVLAPAVGESGALVGVDLSSGMLAKSRARVAKNGWTQVTLAQHDVMRFDAAALSAALGREAQLDRLHIFLGMTAFPSPDEALGNLWSLLRPGGRCVIVDAYAEKLSFQGRMVNLVARADIQRKWWEPLEQRAENFERREAPLAPGSRRADLPRHRHQALSGPGRLRRVRGCCGSGAAGSEVPVAESEAEVRFRGRVRVRFRVRVRVRDRVRVRVRVRVRDRDRGRDGVRVRDRDRC